MNREQATETIRRSLDCRKYLVKSRNGMYCCPFCGSGTGTHKSGALKYYPETNTCACFASCEPDPGRKAKSYGVFDLIQNQYHCDFNRALKIGAEEMGITIETTTGNSSANDRRINEGWNEHKAVMEKQAAADYTAYYEACRQRLGDQAAVSYLTARGISMATAAACGIGFDPAADPANAPGAITDEYRKHPAPRIIIPTSKSHYVGRRTDGNESFAKMNAKDSTPALFNADVLQKQDVQEIFITEGAFDALSIIEVGADALALNSANNVPLLLEMLKKYHTPATLIISLDTDAAGQTGSKAIQEGLQALQIPFVVADITCGLKDQNEALVKDREAFTTAVQQAVSAARTKAAEPKRDYLTDFLETIQGEAYKPYTTGLSFFDNLLGGGLTRQQILLLMAAPGAGKTTLAQQIAESMARNKKPVVYLNLEMSREQMLAKAISSRLARKPGNSIRMNTLQILQGYTWTPEQRAAVTEEIEEYRAEIFPYLKYNPAGTSSDLATIRGYLDQIGSDAKRAGSEAPVIVLDYIHLVSDSKLETQELLKQTMTVLKDYAVDFNTCCIGIAATNRIAISSGQITMGSGRDSSNLEYGADVQLSLNYYKVDSGEVQATDNDGIAKLQKETWRQMILRVLKGRFVSPGRTAKIYFNAENNTFYGETDWMPADPSRVPFAREQRVAAKTR